MFINFPRILGTTSFHLMTALLVLSWAETARAQPTAPVPPAAPSPQAAPTTPTTSSSDASGSQSSTDASGAQSSTPPKADNVDEEAERAAKAKASNHFYKGRDLYLKQSFAAALAEFVQSRQLYPTMSATSSMAACLQKLKRFDEALEMYEVLLQQFGGSLKEKTKVEVQKVVVNLRKVTGSLAIVGPELGATLMVDSRNRGEYPAPAPLVVSPGQHVVRVYKDGFVPFEATVDVDATQTASLLVKMDKLLQSGRLKITEKTGKKLDVLIDGLDVGETPWEGAVSLGEHSVMLRGFGETDSYGTDTSRVMIKENDTQELALTAEDLAASIQIDPMPAAATVFIDGFFVGRGVFEGRMRPGEHTVKVVAEGYLPETRKVTIVAGDNTVIKIQQQRDPDAAMWEEPGHITAEIGGGVPLAISYGGTISADCQDACSQSLGFGGRIGLHAGYEMSNGFGFGFTGGYLGMQQSTTGRAAEIQAVGIPTTNKGLADDTVSIQSFLLGGYGAVRLGKRFPVRLRLGAGIAIGSVTDSRTGQFFSSDPTVTLPYAVGPVVESHSTFWFFMEPEIRVGLPIREHLEVSAGVSALFLITPNAPAWDATHAINASADGYGQFGADTMISFVTYAITPGLSARYEF